VKPDRPSATSRLIAAATVLAARSPADADLVPPGASEWSEAFLSTSPIDRAVLRALHTRLGRGLGRLLERLMLPGIVRHFHLRKRWIEHAWNKGQAEGFNQLVVLGAGLDTLGVRTSRNPAIRVIEADHPATQSIKRRVFPSDTRIQLVEARLDQPGWSAPVAAAIDPSCSTFVVIEGVLMYLGEDQARRVLAELAALPVPALRVAFTFLSRARNVASGFQRRNHLMSWWLRSRGEPFKWMIFSEELAHFVEQSGFSLQSLVDGQTLGGELQGESIAVADRFPMTNVR